MIQLIFAFALTISASAESLSETADFILNGQKSYLPEPDRLVWNANLIRQIDGIQVQLGLASSTETCWRYQQALSKTLTQLTSILGGANLQSNEPSVLFRQRLVIQALLSLQILFAQGAEGGFGTLDGKAIPCEWKTRDELAGSLQTLAQDASIFAREALGSPGFRTLDELNTYLLGKARSGEIWHTVREWEILGAAALVSIFAWYYGPIVTTRAVRHAFGVVPPFTRRPAFKYVVRTTLFTAEGLAVNGILQTWNAAEEIKPREALPTYDQMLSEIERLLSSEDAPQLQLLYVSLIRGQLARLYSPWLEQHANELQSDPRWPELVYLVAEATLLEGKTIPESAVRLQTLFEQTYGYKVSCEEGLLDGLSTFRCQRALQLFARALYLGEIPSLPPQGPVLDVHFSSQRRISKRETAEGVQLRLPVEIANKDLIPSLRATLASKVAAKHLRQAQQFSAALEDLQKNIPIPLVFEEKLSRNEKWRALNTIASVLQKDPQLFKRDSELLYFQSGNSVGLYERGGILTENVGVLSTPAELELFLQQRLQGPPGNLTSIKLLREDNRQIADELKEKFNMKASCSEEVSALFCRQALVKIRHFLLNHFHEFRPASRNFVITGHNEIEHMFEYENAHTPFAAIYLRHAFRLRDFNRYAREQGWLPGWTSGG